MRTKPAPAMPWGIVGIFAVVIALLIVGGVSYQRFTSDCERDGGHVVYLCKSYVCLSDDGRILHTPRIWGDR